MASLKQAQVSLIFLFLYFTVIQYPNFAIYVEFENLGFIACNII
jgi:hypothetical protein